MDYEKLEKYCKEHHLSVSEFERLCEIGNGTIGKWLKGKAEPSFKSLFKMEKYTGIRISEWIGGERR